MEQKSTGERLYRQKWPKAYRNWGNRYQSEVSHMRHNQNGRRFRGRNNNNHGQNNHGGNRRINPRVHTFDSNGPDVRIRGNAMQITEKYVTLARDAQGAGDRVLAESYLQHAEHYQRLLNELTEEQNRHQQQQNQHQNSGNNHNGQSQQNGDDRGNAQNGTGEQPDVPLDDLDQGFLVGKRNAQQTNGKADDDADSDAEEAPARQPRRASSRQKAAETA